MTHGLDADIGVRLRVENQRVCPLHAGGYEGRGSAVGRRYFEWEEPGLWTQVLVGHIRKDYVRQVTVSAVS